MAVGYSFSHRLLDWYTKHKRDLPWRGIKNPYLIWLSEIMSQQTRIDQMLPYYVRFIRRFPNVNSLAEADIHDVLMLWEGLGYYSRARNVHKGAQFISDRYGNGFPDTYQAWLEVPGVGPYTAAAVSSIALGQKKAVVDGNVVRFLSRHFGIKEDVTKSGTKAHIQELADELISENDPGSFNQALMEMGSQVCKPRNPDCENCIFRPGCMAFQHAEVESIPYKPVKKKIPHHQIVVGIVQNDGNELLIARRPEKAMLGGLWEFPGGKQEGGETLEEALHRELREELDIEVGQVRFFFKLNHAYSHFKITLHAFHCRLVKGQPKPKASSALQWIKKRQLQDFPFPRANRKLIDILVEGDHNEAAG